MQYVGSNQATKIFCRDSDGNVPTYVGDNVVGNLRRVMKSFSHASCYITFFQQPTSDLLNDNGDGTYDAYEKDIAIASFYFDEPVAYEYTRQVFGSYNLE